MPQRSSVIATKTCHNEVFVFDRTKHPSKPNKNGYCTPDLRLTGHEKEGYGLSWNPIVEGHLISGSDDKLVCMWDCSGALTSVSRSACQVPPLGIYRGHNDVVEDVAWHNFNPAIFASCGDDRVIMVWDTRSKDNKEGGPAGGRAACAFEAAMGEVNCLAFNPFSENLLLSGSADKTVALWDMRALRVKLHDFTSHTDQIINVAWAPFADSVFASCGADRRVHVWDLSLIGQKQDHYISGVAADDLDLEDGPAELVFIHGGHTDKIADFSWNPNDDWVVASVADDNVLQIWQMAQNIVQDGSNYHPNNQP